MMIHVYINMKPPKNFIKISTIVERDDEQFIPDGETVIELNDGLILSALHYKEKLGNFSLRERVVKKDDRFDNKYIRDIKLRKNERVILLERNGDIIIPTGDVQMREDDIIVINHIR